LLVAGKRYTLNNPKPATFPLECTGLFLFGHHNTNLDMKNVLLVDDDKIFNFINTQMLKQTGMAREIHTALNGKQAIDYLNESYRETSSVPDVILLDLNMPIMNGFDFLEAFKIMGLPDKEKEHVNIIVVTSSDNQQDIDKARDMGANHYLTKPLSAESLKHALEYSE